MALFKLQFLRVAREWHAQPSEYNGQISPPDGGVIDPLYGDEYTAPPKLEKSCNLKRTKLSRVPEVVQISSVLDRINNVLATRLESCDNKSNKENSLAVQMLCEE